MEPAEQCVPEIQIQKVMVPIPGDLRQIWYNPIIPTEGNNEALLDWAEACAITTYLYTEQTKKLKDLK